MTAPSVVVAPVSTLMRRLCPALPITRRRSATGLKSTPKAVPAMAVYGAVTSKASAASVALTVAAPVAGSMVTMRPVDDIPYSKPSLGRMSKPSRRSPAARPVTATLASRVFGVAVLKVTMRASSVKP
ncbi:hypothetical protein D3C72_1458800 [compost metagenome]